MKRNRFVVLISGIALIFSLACVVPTLAQPTATALPPTQLPTTVPTEVPTELPTAAPTDTPVLPTVDPCTDPENQVHGFLDTEATQGFPELDADLHAHFPGQGVIITEGLDADLVKLQKMLADIVAIKAPPFMSKYHELEVAFFTDYIAGIEYAVKGDRQNAFVYLIRSDADFKALKDEIDRLNKICPPVANGQTG